MPQIKVNDFLEYEFTEEEELAAKVFPTLNELWLQSQLAITAGERMNLIIDPQKPLEAGFADAYLRGQMDILKYLLGISNDRKSDLQKHLEATATQQQSDSPIAGQTAIIPTGPITKGNN